jgi:2,6-dihydroxypyridine 3-monooxygenase
VVGGSLGGLTAGLLLRDLGAEVDVYERSRTLFEGLGAGIVLHPATVRYVAERTDHELSELSSRASRIPAALDSSAGGRALTNWVWYRNVPPGPELDGLLTDRDGNLHSVSLAPGAVQDRHVERLRAAATELLPPTLAAMVRHTADPFVQAVFDIEVPRMASAAWA